MFQLTKKLINQPWNGKKLKNSFLNAKENRKQKKKNPSVLKTIFFFFSFEHFYLFYYFYNYFCFLGRLY